MATNDGLGGFGTALSHLFCVGFFYFSVNFNLLFNQTFHISVFIVYK